jgi:hypothetical protein
MVSNAGQGLLEQCDHLIDGQIVVMHTYLAMAIFCFDCDGGHICLIRSSLMPKSANALAQDWQA